MRDTGWVLGKLNWAAESGLVLTVNGGFRLAGMQERLLLIAGSLSAGPDDGNWVVTAQVPQ